MNMTIEISFLFTNEDLKKKHNRLEWNYREGLILLYS